MLLLYKLTKCVLEEVEPPAKEPPEMRDIEQALVTLMDYTKSTAGSSKQHELFLSPHTKVLNERTSKKLAAAYCPARSYEPVRMGPQGEPARQQHQRSQQHGRGAFGAQFLQAVGSYA
jgi:hypothetical protein